MNTKTKLFLGVTLVAAIAVSTTGCMTSHGSGEYVGSKAATQSFNGWTTNPNQEVHLYALKGYNEWVYLGEANVGSSGYNYFGAKWYFWYRSVNVPANCWHYVGSSSPGDYLAIIKAVDANGTALYYFEPGFYQYYDDYDSLGEMWSDRGVNAQSIVIYGD